MSFFNLNPLPELIEEAVLFLQQFKKDKVMVRFSGGKDSIVIKKLADLAKLDYDSYYSVTGLDPPELVKNIRKNYSDVIFLTPKKSFYNSIKNNMDPPSIYIRWCCTSLKKQIPAKINNKYNIKLLGIRKEESNRRSLYPRIKKGKKVDRVHPILDWPETSVWEFIEFFNLPYPILYDEGFSRLGCIICPYKSYKLHIRDMKRWPKQYKRFEKFVTKWWIKKQKEGNEMFHNSPEDFLSDWYKNNGMAMKFKKEKNHKGFGL